MTHGLRLEMIQHIFVLTTRLRLVALTISLLAFIGCDSSTPAPAAPGFTLNYPRAAPNETLVATLSNLDGNNVDVSLGGIAATVTRRTANQISFVVPDGSPAGVQPLRIRQDDRTATGTVTVFGDVVPDKVSVLVPAGTSRAQLQTLANQQGFTLEQFRDLAGAGVCGSSVADLDIAGTPFVEALAALEASDVVLTADPRGRYSLDSSQADVRYLASSSVADEHARGITGTGVTIAVLDTGVSSHPELAGRLLPGVDTVNDDNDPSDDFDDPATAFVGDGHGTAAAVLAAGQRRGLAPSAQVLPVKVCDETGTCLASDVAVGVCYALSQVPDPNALVINLSLGGDTPVTLLEQLLKHATDQGAVIAAAAGNRGESGSPQHYPAAFDNPALLAVAALDANPARCVRGDSLAVGTSFAVGDTFTEDGINVTVASFVLEGEPPLPEPPFADGTLQVSGASALQSGRALSSDRVNLALDFAEVVAGFQVDIADYQANVNLEVNGDFINHQGALAELSGRELGGVQLEVFDTPGGQTLALLGDLRRVSVGVRGGVLDNLCEQTGAGDAWDVASFSTKGDYVDIAAPGASLTSGTPQGGTFSDFAGTSFASPQVAGALALLRQVNPDATSQTIAQSLLEQAIPLLADRDEVGAGQLNVTLEP